MFERHFCELCNSKVFFQTVKKLFLLCLLAPGISLLRAPVAKAQSHNSSQMTMGRHLTSWYLSAPLTFKGARSGARGELSSRVLNEL